MSCAGSLPPYWWRDAELLVKEREAHGGWEHVRRAHPDNCVSSRAFTDWWARHGLPPLPKGPRPLHPAAPLHLDAENGLDDSWLLAALKKAGDSASVEQLADTADCSPRKVREALERLGHDGYRVEEEEGRVEIQRVPPKSPNLHKALFDGEHVRVGVVADTHMGSNEEALEELHVAYDVFEKEGITQVWHAGDWGTGIEIFRGHHSEAHVHTLDEQVEYLVVNYPKRKGIITRGIGGNHDLQGLAGKAGLDPIVAFANQRDDIDYLGPFEAWLEIKPETGRWIHLLHGSGGMSYSYSYKAQKIVDSYQSARKPVLLIPGHWHVRGSFRARDVEVLFPGCFEWQSLFMARLGLQPAVGFHVLDMVVADDGSIVRYRPEWWPYYPGRKIGSKRAPVLEVPGRKAA